MSSGDGSVSTPWQPCPKMQRHDDVRNVTSICHCFFSLPATGNVTHSREGRVMRGIVTSRAPLGGDSRRYPATITDTTLLADLRAALGPGGASAEPLELALYGRDAGVSTGEAAAVCWPRSDADV